MLVMVSSTTEELKVRHAGAGLIDDSWYFPELTGWWTCCE
jgi:hypothetical protein